MPNAKNIIKANENKDGKVIISLYGEEFDITKSIRNGKAEVKLFGNKYEVQVSTSKKPRARKIEVKEKNKSYKPEIKFIKTPIK